jgi:ATP-dependent Clp protease ATP-binding subunit ClpA
MRAFDVTDAKSPRAASHTASVPALEAHRKHIEQRAALTRFQPAFVARPSVEATI